MKNLKEKGITLIALVVTIVVLLILAGVTISMLTGENGIINQAKNAKEESLKSELEELVDLTLTEYKTDKAVGKDTDLGELLNEKVKDKTFESVTEEEDCYIVEKNGYEVKISKEGDRLTDAEKVGGVRPQLEANLYQENGNPVEEGTSYETVVLTVNIKNKADLGTVDEIKVTNSEGTEMTKESTVTGTGHASFKVDVGKIYTILVKATTNGIQKEATIKKSTSIAPEQWEITSESDAEWYVYTDISVGEKVVKVNKPVLKGEMTPIKYTGEVQTGSKWANAITADGSMFVWIPRYAYKITSGYHTNIAGTIEVAFIDTNNRFLNGETGEILTDPKAEGAGTTKWLVHPAFTTSAENGGGFGEISGLWIGKFETTGTKENITVKPGEVSLGDMTINEQYKAGLVAKFGETVDLNSHMAKNSEWGVVVYLGHSKYGRNGQKIERNTNSSFYTGGNNTKNIIYTTNKGQSTTNNATGVYDLNGGAYEYVASYVNYENSTSLATYGGTQRGDLYGISTEQGISTKYKTVYKASGTDNNASYELAKGIKGDAIYETSNDYSVTASWFNEPAYFPNTGGTFFTRSGGINNINPSGSFYFWHMNGNRGKDYSFRVVLTF